MHYSPSIPTNDPIGKKSDLPTIFGGLASEAKIAKPLTRHFADGISRYKQKPLENHR